MPTIINVGSWQLWFIVIVILFVVAWAIWGGRRDIEVVGLQPLYPPTAHDYPVSVSPRYADPARLLPRAGLQTEALPPVRRDPFIAPEPEVRPIALEVAPPRIHIDVPSFQTKRNRSIGEELTCAAFEELLGRKVNHNLRPDYLKNPRTGMNLEYDCFDPVSGIAVEYNGRQHDEYVPFFHKSVTDFEDQQYRDGEKVRLSIKAGVPLIVVNHKVDTCNASGRHKPHSTPQERYSRIYVYLANQLQVLKTRQALSSAAMQE